MPRTHGRILVTIWSDKEFLALSTEAQRFYMLVLSQPKLSYCGVLPYTPRRWTLLAANDTLKGVLRAVKEGVDRRYVVVDENTEELWIRTFVKHDGLLKSPNLVKAMWKDFAEVQSDVIREGFLKGLPEGFREPPPQPPPEGMKEPIGESNGRGSRAGHAGLPLPLPLLHQDLDPSLNHQVGLVVVGESEMDQPQAPTPHRPPDPIVERLLTAWPEQRRRRHATAALAAVAEGRRWLDPHLIDEVVGHMLGMATPPATPRYLLVVAPDWAQQRGANLSAEALASMASAARAPSDWGAA